MANLTCKELLNRVNSPDHQSQEYFAPFKDGRMLDTCKLNGYTFTGGYGNGSAPGLSRPDFVRLRAEARMRDLNSNSS